MAKYQAEGYRVMPLPDGDFAATPPDDTSPLLGKKEEEALWKFQDD